MMVMPSLTRSSASASPIRTFSSSDSTTQGPAMRNGPPPFSAPKRCDMSVGQPCQLARPRTVAMELAVTERRADESRKQGMRAHGP